MSAASNKSASRYDAFISYSRKDGVFVEKLSRTLTKFKPPREIGFGTGHMVVFRDKKDLVGAEYYDSIERSIRAARKLLVVCSPDSARSEYVDDEIRRYVSAHRAEDVIAVLVAGLPNNEAGPESEEKAFPPSLVESLALPLAIDYRGFDASSDRIDRGRFEDAWYSLLARIYDKERSEIEQRVQARRRKARRAWASAAVALIAVLTGLTLYAFQQKGVAERQARISHANYLAAESRFHVEGDARLSFLLAKHSWQIEPSASARRNLVAAFYRNSFAYVTDEAWGTQTVFASPFYQRVDGASDVQVARVLQQPCPSPSLPYDPDELTGSAQADFAGKTLSLRFEGVTLGNVMPPIGEEASDPAEFCISEVFLSPDESSLLLRRPYPRPHVLWWHPEWNELSTLGQEELVESTAYAPDSVHFALLREGGTIELWRHDERITRLHHEGQSGPLSFSKDGRYVFARTADSVLRWDLRAIEIPKFEHDPMFADVAFSSDGRYLLHGAMWGGADDRVDAYDLQGIDVTESKTQDEWKREWELATAQAPADYRLEVHSEWHLKGFADEYFGVKDREGNTLFSLKVPGVGRVSTGPAAIGAVSGNGDHVYVVSADRVRHHLFPLSPRELIERVDAVGFRLSTEERERYGIE